LKCYIWLTLQDVFGDLIFALNYSQQNEFYFIIFLFLQLVEIGENGEDVDTMLNGK